MERPRRSPRPRSARARGRVQRARPDRRHPVAGARLRDIHNGFTIPPTLSLRTLVDIALHPGWWFDKLTTEPLRFAVFTETGGTVADLINRVFDPTITIADLAWLREAWDGPIVIKGIQTVDDACAVVDAGADAIVISNHGGRQLDRAPTPLEQLPSIAAAVGDRAEVYVDGGVLSGADVVAAVAMGARAVLVGRAYLYGLMAGGERGVAARRRAAPQGVRPDDAVARRPADRGPRPLAGSAARPLTYRAVRAQENVDVRRRTSVGQIGDVHPQKPMTGLIRDPDRPGGNDSRVGIGRTDRDEPLDRSGVGIHPNEPSFRVPIVVLEEADEPGFAVDDGHGPPVTWRHGRDRRHRVRCGIDPAGRARADSWPKQLNQTLSGNSPVMSQLSSPFASIEALTEPEAGSTRSIVVVLSDGNHRSPRPAVP